MTVDGQAPIPPTRLWHKVLSGGGFWPAVPAVTYLTFFMVLPLGTLLMFGFVTFDRGRMLADSLTVQPLLNALHDPLVGHLMWRSFWVAAASSVLTLLLGYPVAFCFGTLKGIWRALILVAIASPLLTSALVRTYAWLVILGGRRGILNQSLLSLGLIDEPLHILNTDWAVLIGMTQIHLPFMILPLLAVLSERDRRLEEASLNLGSSRTGTFFKVTVPLSVPAISAGIALVFAVAYTNFIVPQLLGGGNYSTLALQVYEQTIVVLDWTRGAVLATLLLSTCLIFVLAIVLIGQTLAHWNEQR
jgi:ABC-type spermidine/putrescine transport system permease subunit I